MEEQRLTTAELAERYRTVPSTIRYWRHRGYGPKGMKVGRKVLYRLADVVAWERREEAKQEPPPGHRKSAA